METVEIFDWTRLLAAALARLSNWLTDLSAVRRDLDGAPTGAEEAALAREAADRACCESSAPPGA
jgi:hypothetical protein